jgi:hypothetical protein
MIHSPAVVCTSSPGMTLRLSAVCGYALFRLAVPDRRHPDLSAHRGTQRGGWQYGRLRRSQPRPQLAGRDVLKDSRGRRHALARLVGDVPAALDAATDVVDAGGGLVQDAVYLHAASSAARVNRRRAVWLVVIVFSLACRSPLAGCVQLVRRNGPVHLCFAVIAQKPESACGQERVFYPPGKHGLCTWNVAVRVLFTAHRAIKLT